MRRFFGADDGGVGAGLIGVGGFVVTREKKREKLKPEDQSFVLLYRVPPVRDIGRLVRTPRRRVMAHLSACCRCGFDSCSLFSATGVSVGTKHLNQVLRTLFCLLNSSLLRFLLNDGLSLTATYNVRKIFF